jgi:hypothetical protein
MPPKSRVILTCNIPRQQNLPRASNPSHDCRASYCRVLGGDHGNRVRQFLCRFFRGFACCPHCRFLSRVNVRADDSASRLFGPFPHDGRAA